MAHRETRYRSYLAARERDGLLRSLHDLGREDARTVTAGGRTYLNFSGNDYLGLSADPRLVAAARGWAARFGAGAAASRLVTGNLEAFAEIEHKVSALKGTEAALVMASGFQANAAVLHALLDDTVLGAEPLVFADRLNHASMHFGCQAAGARQIRYRHCDADHLAGLLDRHRGSDRPKFVLTESVFSMDGDLSPMDRIAALTEVHGATLVCDDAHATGVLGEGGRGLSAGAHIVVGTFSKALGSFGAYVACSQVMRDYLVNRCAGLIYSTALPPPVLGAIDAALGLLPGLDAARAHVAALAARFRNEANRLGYDTGASATQIVPLIVGEAEAALALSGHLRETGIWATPIRPPTVPRGTARIRFAFSAAHRESDLDALLAALGAPAARRATA